MFTPKLPPVSSRRILSLSTTKQSPITPFTSRDLRTPRTRSVSKATRVFRKSDYYCLEVFDSLPVPAQEVLVDARHSHVKVTCKFTESGHCLVVSSSGGLVVWNIQKSQSTRPLKMAACDGGEFTADHVDISEQGSSVSLLASSPDGRIQYVANVNRSTSMTLVGQISLDAGDSVVLLSSDETRESFVVGTMQGLVYVVRVFLNAHPVSLEWQKLQPHPSQGIISGLSQRVSSFLFGGSSKQQSNASATEERVRAIVHSGQKSSDPDSEIFVLSDTRIWLWKLSSGRNKLLADVSLTSLISEALSGESVTQLTALDMVSGGDNLLVLTSLSTGEEEMHCLVELNLSLEIVSVDKSLAQGSFGSSTNQPTLCRLMGVDRETVIAHGSHTVWVPPGSSRPADCLQVPPSDSFLGGGICQGKVIFLTKSHGAVSFLERTDLAPLPRSAVKPAASAAKKRRANSNSGVVDKLREAFVLFCQSEDTTVKVKEIASNILSDLEPPEPGIPSALDAAVLALSLEIIDDHPGSDPRWAEASSGVLSSSAVIILDHLNSKLQVHSILLQFLATLEFFDKLGIVEVDERRLPTVLALREHQEKLIAATELRKQHTRHTKLIDAAIQRALNQHMDLSQYSGLTPIDLFYKNVSCVQFVVTGILEEELSCLEGRVDQKEATELFHIVCSVLEATIGGALAHRMKTEQLGLDALPQALKSNLKQLGPSFTLWTDVETDFGIRGALLKQLQLLLEKYHSFTDQDSSLLQALASVAEVVLTSYMLQIELYKQIDFDDPFVDHLKEKYSQGKAMAIMPLVRSGLDDVAMRLAEKYREFGVLLRLCDSTDDSRQFQEYAEKYKEEGFVEFMFQWYIDEGKVAKLLEVPDAYCDALTKFLFAHPRLSWLHHIRTNSLNEAHEVVSSLAAEEKNRVMRQKTLLSLAKLSLLASGNQDDSTEDKIGEIDEQLDVILHQEQLPNEVKEKAGLDLEADPPLSPLRLIDLYTNEVTNPNASVEDFRKAQDLVGYVNPEDCDVNQLIFSIWARAVLRDEWTAMDGSEPLASIRETLFYRICLLAHEQGLDLQTYVPPLEKILNVQEMKESGLAEDKHFLYLVKLMYEDLDLRIAIEDEPDITIEDEPDS